MTVQQETVIVQIVQHLRPGGIEVLCLNMLRHTQHKMFIVALEGNEADSLANWPLLKDFQSQLIFLDKPAGFRWSTVKKLRQELAHRHTTAIHTHHLGPLLYGKLSTLGLPYRHVHTEHDAWHLDDRKQRWLTRLLLLSPTQLVADADSVADDISRKLKTPSPSVILNGIDTHYFSPGDSRIARQALGLPESGYLIGCAGRLVAEKSLETLITILPQIPLHVTVVVAGDGEMKERWQALAAEMQVAERITWLGHTQAMRDFYRAIDIFCMPSVREGLPLALLEAQACGNSVVASRVGAIPDLINPETGYLFTPNNEFELLTQLQKMLGASAQTASKLNHQFVADKADVRTMVSQYEQLACDSSEI